MSVTVKRGEIYLVNWNPSRGSEQEGIRPALIIQNDLGNQYSTTTIVAAICTKFKKQYPFLVLIKARESGLDSDSVINLSQIMTIDKSRLVKKLGQIKAETLKSVDRALVHSLNIL
jgi:mRNA interferase MazF